MRLTTNPKHDLHLAAVIDIHLLVSVNSLIISLNALPYFPLLLLNVFITEDSTTSHSSFYTDMTRMSKHISNWESLSCLFNRSMVKYSRVCLVYLHLEVYCCKTSNASWKAIRLTSLAISLVQTARPFSSNELKSSFNVFCSSRYTLLLIYHFLCFIFSAKESSLYSSSCSSCCSCSVCWFASGGWLYID